MNADAGKWRRRASSSAILAAIVFGLLALACAFGLLQPLSQPTVRIGGPFSLTSHTGAKLADTDLRGQPFTMFFGFTHCPEVCPTTLWEMSQALQQLGPEADQLKVLFVTVDPERDTADALASYLQSFDRRIIGLTGSPDEIRAAADRYRAYWRRIALDGGDYTMDHTASVFLMDAKGDFFGTIAYEEQADVRLDKLRRLLAGTGS